MRATIFAVIVLSLAAWSANTVHAETFSISGLVWDDVNGDGVRQPSERGLPNVSVQLGNVLQRPLARTNADGAYTFTSLEPGLYTVSLPGRLNRFLTHPVRQGTGQYATSVGVSTGSVTNVNFGLHAAVDAPTFFGLPWVHGALELSPDVRALVEGVDCTVLGLAPPDSFQYTVSVVASSLVPGCGEPGKTIHFTINGQLTDQTAVWQTGGRIGLGLTVGGPFAYFTPDLVRPDGKFELYNGERIEAFIDGRLCATTSHFGQGGSIIVLMSRANGGCGYDGAVITFNFEGRPLQETAVWRPGGQSGPRIALTSSGGDAPTIRPPAAGDAGLVTP